MIVQRVQFRRMQRLGLALIGLGVLLVGVIFTGGCASSVARAREADWKARAMRAAHAADEGRASESADLLTQLWKEKAVSPQPEGGIPPGSLVFGTAVVMKNEKVAPLLGPNLRAQLADLEARIITGKADEHETEVWYDLVGATDEMDSIVRVVEAGRSNRRIIKPLLSPANQRRAIQNVLRSMGREDTAKVLDLTDGESFAEGVGDVLRFTSKLTPGLLATY
jgi:hypothetical protein